MPFDARNFRHPSAFPTDGLRGVQIGPGGFTLIEVVIGLVLLCVLLASAIPSFARILSNHRATTAISDLHRALNLARSEAIKQGRRVYIAPFNGRWHDGWAVFVDRNDNRVFDPPGIGPGDELIARHDPLPDSITITNPSSPTREPFTDLGAPRRTYVMFDGSGYPRQRNGALNIGSLVVTDRTGSVISQRTLCLAAYGRIRIAVDRAGCS